MRFAVILLSVVWLAGCMPEQTRYGSHRDGYDRDDSYGYDSYRHYYPYGREDYPRDRIYVVERPSGCNHGRVYQGYCYLHDDDYRRAVDWDRQQGYDDHWHQQRKSWCDQHDCRRQDRDHQARPDKNNDAESQRPVWQRPEPVTPAVEQDVDRNGREKWRTEGRDLQRENRQHHERQPPESQPQENQQRESHRWGASRQESPRQESPRQEPQRQIQRQRREQADAAVDDPADKPMPAERHKKQRFGRGNPEEPQENQQQQ